MLYVIMKHQIIYFEPKSECFRERGGFIRHIDVNEGTKGVSDRYAHAEIPAFLYFRRKYPTNRFMFWTVAVKHACCCIAWRPRHRARPRPWQHFASAKMCSTRLRSFCESLYSEVRMSVRIWLRVFTSLTFFMRLCLRSGMYVSVFHDGCGS